MAIILRIISADGRKAISQVLPSLPSKIKAPRGAKIEITEVETDITMSIGQYINKYVNDAPADAHVTVEEVEDWAEASAWLESLGALSSRALSPKDWYGAQASDSEGDVLGFDQNTLLLGAAVGGGLAAGLLILTDKSGPKDDTPPVAPNGLDLVSADDTGPSNSDNITSATSGLTITGTAEAGAEIEIFEGDVSLGKTVVGADGTFSLDINLEPGPHALRAVATDAAGNTSAASASLTIVVDNTAPTIPIGLDLAAADDTGASNSDNLTSKTSGLTISGNASGAARVELFNGTISLGTATVAANGGFTIDVSLPAGVNSVTARALDAAGNASDASATIQITVDPSEALPVTNLDLAAADDSGISASDNITTQTTSLTITGNAEPNSVVDVLNGVASLGTVTAGLTGQFTYEASLAPGSHTLTFRPSGTTSTEKASQISITVDTTAPVAPTAIGLDGEDDDGVSNSDDVTSRTTDLTISGLAEAGSVIEIFDGSVSVATTASGANGVFVLDIDLPEGEHVITARSRDSAGNIGPASSPLEITVVPTFSEASVQDFQMAAVLSVLESTSSSDEIISSAFLIA